MKSLRVKQLIVRGNWYELLSLKLKDSLSFMDAQQLNIWPKDLGTLVLLQR